MGCTDALTKSSLHLSLGSDLCSSCFCFISSTISTHARVAHQLSQVNGTCRAWGARKTVKDQGIRQGTNECVYGAAACKRGSFRVVGPFASAGEVARLGGSAGLCVSALLRCLGVL